MHNSSNGYLYASAASSGHLAWQNSENSYWRYNSSNWSYADNNAYLRPYNDSFRTYGNNSGDCALKLAKKNSSTAYYISVVEITNYTITVSASPAAGGTVSQSGTGTYSHGSSCTLTATPNVGYVFTRWTKDGTPASTNASYTFEVTENASYVAVFTPTYTVSATVDPANSGTITGAGTYTQGANITLVATANTSYRFANWTENGTVVSTSASYNINNITANHTLVAHFTRTYAITATTNPTGSGEITGTGNYASGESCTLTVTPAAGHHFTNWTKDGQVVSTDNPYTFTVTEAAAYVANFTVESYTVSVAALPSSYGTVSQSGTGTYSHGSSCTVTATANSALGYEFINWTEDGAPVSSNATYTFTVTGNRDLVANFGVPCDYVKVTASQSDWSGDYVIAYDNGSTAIVLSGQAGTNDYGDYETINQNQTEHSLADADVSSYNIIIEKVGSNDYYTLKQGNYYLYYTSGNNLYFSTEIGTTPNQYYWTITYSGSTMTIENVYSTGRIIRWNSSATRFACYLNASNQTEISLYKKEVCGPTCPVPANLAVNNITGNSASVSWTGEGESYNLRYRTLTTTEGAAPFTEDFSNQTAVSYNAANGQLPEGWHSYNSSSSGYAPRVSNKSSYSFISAFGDSNNFLLMTFNGNTQKAYAIMPKYDGITAVQFKYAYENTGQGNFTVGYVTNNTGYSTYQVLQTPSKVTSATTVTLSANDIATINNANGYIAFCYEGTSGSSYYSVGIDDITVTYNQTIVVGGPWTPSNTGTSATSSPYTLSGLTHATNYEVQVQSICEYGLESEWSEGVTFTTLSGYTLSTSVTPQVGGTISANGTTISGDVTYAPGTELELTAVAATGYTFQTWYIDGTPYQGNPANVTMDQDHTVAANFTINTYSYTATAMPQEGGVMQLNGGEPNNNLGGSNDYGTELSFEAIANVGYHFVNWTEGETVLTDQATYAFTLEGNRTLAANFAINSYAVTIEANPSNGGTLTGSTSGNYNHGATVTVTATPNTGYHFVNWTVDGTEVSTSATLSGYAITSACAIRANFEIDSYAVTIEANPAVGGAVSGYASGNYDYGTVITVNATANPGYHFVNWTVDDVVESTSTTLSGYVITSACTISANFDPDTFVIGATVAPENSGSVEGAGTYDYNTTCTLTATPNEGFTFVNWTKNGVGVSNNATYSFTVTADASYVANFQRNSYSITVAAMPSNGGIATGAGTYNHGVSVTVNATPNAGYQFVNWTVNNNVVSTSASYTFTATEALNLVANFLYAVVPPTVATNSQVTNVTGSSAQCGGQITSTGYGYISAYGFCWNTTGEPTIQDSHYQVGISTTNPFTYNITGLNANTLYYVRAYATNQEGTAYGNEVTFATMAQVTTTAVTAHTLDAIMGGSWVSGSGDATVTACGVEYKEATASAWQTATMSVPASGTSFSGTVSGLTANTNYVVRAFVTNGGGTSYGTEVPFTTIGYFAVSATVNPAESGTVSFAPEGNGQGSAAKTVTIGTGNSNQGFYPINNGFAYSFDEMIYPGGGETTAGNITQISFHIDGSNSSSSFNVDVYLKTVGNTTAFTNGQPIELTSNDKYYSGTVTASKNAQWVTIALGTPFTYNGTDNILVGIDYNSGTGDLRNWYATETNAVTSLCYYGDSNINPTVYPIENCSSLYEFGESYCMQRPNIRFTIEAADANTQWYSWGSTPTLTAEPATGYQFLNWTENGVVVSTDNPYTMESIEDNHDLVANFAICKTFTNADGDHDWDNAANWAPAGVPNGEDVVIAAAATISNSTVASVNNISISTGSITIEDGGQLKHNNDGVVVTTKKSITGYGSANANTNKGYYLISSPVDGIGYNNVTGLATTHYDLYKFVSNNEESGELREWVHVDGNLQAKKGYLYASETTTTLGITGTVAHSATDIVETLTYNEGFRFGGWNLVGNPFVCDAYVTRSSNEMNYYVLNHEAGYDEFTTASSTDPIAPMSGLMVQATATGQTITYSRTAPSKGSGILNMDVRKTMERGIATLDRARVRFGEGINLEKFQLDARHTKISIPEGSNEYSVYYADGAGTIPVNFKAQDNGRYTLDFSTEEIGFNYLHLIDNMTGNDVDLLQTPFYAFDAKSTDYASRFTLVFATGNNDGESTFAFFNNGHWIINNDGKAELQVVDALGRILSSETISGSCSKAINVAPGVYMLRLINGNDVKVQKVVVKR